jgi:hypothetical protein
MIRGAARSAASAVVSMTYGFPRVSLVDDGHSHRIAGGRVEAVTITDPLVAPTSDPEGIGEGNDEGLSPANGPNSVHTRQLRRNVGQGAY